MATYTIVGLGNPGNEYEDTRHNTGRIVADYIAKKNDFDELKFDKKSNALVAKGEIGGKPARIVEPETFMNKSGAAVAYFAKSPKDAERTIVIYDELDLPLGAMKISFNRGSGGHKGLESVIRALKTREFVRVRVGISKATPSGKIKKPSGEDKVLDFIIGKYRKEELDIIKKIAKKAAEAVEMVITEGREKAMGEFNQ